MQSSELCNGNDVMADKLAAECARDYKVLAMDGQYAASRLTQVGTVPESATCASHAHLHR